MNKFSFEKQKKGIVINNPNNESIDFKADATPRLFDINEDELTSLREGIVFIEPEYTEAKLVKDLEIINYEDNDEEIIEEPSWTSAIKENLKEKAELSKRHEELLARETDFGLSGEIPIDEIPQQYSFNEMETEAIPEEIFTQKPTFVSKIKLNEVEQMKNVKMETPQRKSKSSPYHFNDVSEFSFNMTLSKLKVGSFHEPNDALGVIGKVNVIKMIMNDIGITNIEDIIYGEAYKFQWIQIVFEREIDKVDFNAKLLDKAYTKLLGSKIHFRTIDYNVLRIEFGKNMVSSIRLRDVLDNRQYTKSEPLQLITGFDEMRNPFTLNLNVNNVISIDGENKNEITEFKNTLIASMLYKKDNAKFKFAFINDATDNPYKRFNNTFFNEMNKLAALSMLESLGREIEERKIQASLKLSGQYLVNEDYKNIATIVVFIDEFDNFITALPREKGNFVFELMENAKEQKVIFVLTMKEKRRLPNKFSYQVSFCSENDPHLFHGCDSEILDSNSEIQQRIYSVLTPNGEMEDLLKEMEKQKNEKGIGIKTSQQNKASY